MKSKSDKLSKARHELSEMYEGTRHHGRKGQIYWGNWLCENVWWFEIVFDALKEDKYRQSATSEEVAEAIEELSQASDRSHYAQDGAHVKTLISLATIDLAITALKEYQPWVPVSERLPDDINEYLIVIKHKYECEKKWQYDVDVATSKGSYLNNFWDTDNDWDEGQEIHVTHWRPLPEPPKGDAR